MPEPTTPLSEEAAKDEAERLIRAAYQPTRVVVEDPAIPSYKDGPRIGDAAPVAQPGIPPMTAGAVDTSVKMIAAGFLSLCLGGAVSAVLYFSHHANETVVFTVCAAPPAALLSLKTLVKSAKKAGVPDVHNHVHNGPSYHETNVDRRRAVWQKDVDKSHR